MRRVALVAVLLALAACSESAEKRRRRPQPDEARRETETPPPGPTLVAPSPSDDPARFVYVVSNDARLYRFDPRLPGLAAYGLIGRISCPGSGHPQSMAVDRAGTAWVFYDTRELFRVNTRDASCESTKYKHPSAEYRLGMAFTAAEPGSSVEQLYIESPDFGLALVDTTSLKVQKLKALPAMGELTGGIDGRLFLFEAHGAALSEIARPGHTRAPLHTFSLAGVEAWAFARYAGLFYVFTSTDLSTSRTTIYDPRTNEERLRDPVVDFAIVGAGQSTKVPPMDGGFDLP